MYKTYYIYIMSNTKNSVLYVGMTNDLKRRVEEHKSNSIPGFTQRYCCHKLVYFETYSDVDQAIYREKQIKGWLRIKKDELIDSTNKERKDLYNEIV
ncbi:MAG: GIY-YIG nuclease family protein [Bacteroidales bacterium]|nr:GIY-YIG nuclease family protein [Bacteroidales bacterium]